MGRNKVAVMPLMLVRRSITEKVKDAAWNPIQHRVPTTQAESPKLLAYRKCVQKKLKGSKPGSLKAAQEQFKRIAAECKAEVAGIPSAEKPGSRRAVPIIFA